MNCRAIWVLAVALAAVAIAGCPRAETQSPPEKRPDGVVGYYVHDDPAVYGATDMDAVPPGQVMYLGIEDGRWMMRNMMSGYGGTWIDGKDGAMLTVSEGPTGKTDGKEKLVAKRTDGGVTLSAAGSKKVAMRFTFVAAVALENFGYDEFLGKKK